MKYTQFGAAAITLALMLVGVSQAQQQKPDPANRREEGAEAEAAAKRRGVREKVSYGLVGADLIRQGLTDSDGDGVLDKDDNLPYLPNPETQGVSPREAFPLGAELQNQGLREDLRFLTPEAPADKAMRAAEHVISETGLYGGCDRQNLCGKALDAICDLASSHPDQAVQDHTRRLCGIGRGMRDGMSWGWWWWPWNQGPKELAQGHVIGERECVVITEKTGGWYHWWRWPWYQGWWVVNPWRWWWYPVEQIKEEIKCQSCCGEITKEFQIHLVFQPVWWWRWGWWHHIDP